MRQSGILAAGALYALHNHRARLVEDHANAKRFAEIVAASAQGNSAKIDLARVETNIVNIELEEPLGSDVVTKHARSLGLALNSTGAHRMRAVMHLDVTREGAEKGAQILVDAVTRARGA
jgi:threonine aldolase